MAAEEEDPEPGNPDPERQNLVGQDEEKGRRMRELLEVQREVSTEHYKRFIGRTLRVLVDGTAKKREGWLTGKSGEFIIVEFEGDRSLIGKFVNINVTGAMNWAVTGRLVSD